MKKLFVFTISFLMHFTYVNAQKTVYTMPEVNKILKEIHLYVDVELDDSVKIATGLLNSMYLVPLTNYIDYNEIGKGNSATIYDNDLREFIIRKAAEGNKAAVIGQKLVDEYIRLKTSGIDQKEKEDIFTIGGFLAAETEYHQEDDGSYHTLFEVNQLRLFFASHINTTKKGNKVSVFAEFNPVPEEVIHQIDQAVITKGSSTDTLMMPHIHIEEGELIPFERLFVNIQNVGGSKISLTIGQFRNPFGLWSDYTSHRNFTAAKNNALVNGFALKKIELGLKADFPIGNNLLLEAAIVHGRFGRTSPLSRADMDDKKDLITRISYNKNRFSAGASGYFSELSTQKRTAYGIDLAYRFDKLLVSGEYIIQTNNQVGYTAPKISPFITQLSSTSGYLQFDYELSQKLHFYGMYDIWQLKADNKKVDKPTFKMFHGFKYSINSKTRWTILEYGHMTHREFNEGNNHFSTQLEINF